MDISYTDRTFNNCDMKKRIDKTIKDVNKSNIVNMKFIIILITLQQVELPII